MKERCAHLAMMRITDRAVSMKSLENLRVEYQKGRLDEAALLDDPVEFFKLWLNQAMEAQLPEPNAMTVATVDENGQPRQRIVLLKQLTEQGFVFFTNLGSRKANDIRQNTKVSLHFPWHYMERQVRVNGTASELSRTEVLKYFLSRPRDSQLGAWASQQSQPISTRQLLITQFMQVKEKFAKGEIPLPDFWGGFCVEANEIEFWQGGEHRLHDRIEYKKDAKGTWHHQRLMP